jgi:hypothetical protein
MPVHGDLSATEGGLNDRIIDALRDWRCEASVVSALTPRLVRE